MSSSAISLVTVSLLERIVKRYICKMRRSEMNLLIRRMCESLWHIVHIPAPDDSAPTAVNIQLAVLVCGWCQHKPYCLDSDRYRPIVACRSRAIYFEQPANRVGFVLWIPFVLVVVHYEWRSILDICVIDLLRSTDCKVDAYPPKFFHRAKNDSPFISVGSKNLFIVSGNLTLSFCWVPLYRNDISSVGVSVGPNENEIWLK